MEDKEKKIKELINNIKPYINEEGGDIEFIRLEDNYVFIKLTGACAYCGFQDDTINNGILKMFQEEIPEIEGVINVDF